MRLQIKNLLTQDKALFLSAHQGLETGAKHFTLQSVNPTHLLDIALEGQFNGVIMHSGLAEKYYHEAYKDIPLLVKLNAELQNKHAVIHTRQLCSVDRAIKLGAAAVSYTLQEHSDSISEFGRIVEQAHDYGIPVLAQMDTKKETTEELAHAARLALELGADFANLNYHHNPEAFQWVTQNAGRMRVLIREEHKHDPVDLLYLAKEQLSTGISGFELGTNIWQEHNALALTQALQDILFQNKEVNDVLHYLHEN